MGNMKKILLSAALVLLVSNAAYAGNNNGPDYGDVTNNNQTYNQPTANGGAGGHGGSASAVAGGGSGYGYGGDASVGDIRNTNTNTVLGGQGGQGGIGLGGSAHQGQAQGQQQGQGQSQSNIGVNGQTQGIDSTIKNSVGTSTTTGTSTSTTTGQSQSANNAGNSQSVGGQSVTINEAEIPDDVTVRQAPTMIVSAPNATVSCYKTFGGSLSGILGGAGFSGGKIDEQCEFRETVRIAAAVDRDGATNMLCLSQMYAAANASKCAGVRPVFLFEGQAGKQYKANVAADKK